MLDRILTQIIKARVLIMVLVGFLLALGFYTYQNLRVDLFPPLNFPILNIITEVPSFSSIEIERQITLPIESAAGSVLGVSKVRSTSATGISMVSVEFQWGTDMILSRQLLIESLSALRAQLPKAAEPTIENLSATLSMIEGYSLQGGSDLIQLRDQAVYDLKPRLQRIPGVYKVLVMGGRTAEFSVKPNPYLMVKYDVSLDNLRDALANNNILASPGVINHFSQELVLHSNGQFADEKEIGNVVISVKSGTPVLMKNLAMITKSFQYERGDTSEQGAPAILINILKQPNFDTGAVAAGVAAEMAHFKASLPKSYSLNNYYDQAQLVEASIGSVKESVWIGGILVVLVLALFLRSFNTTLIATLSIPISVVAAIIMMKLTGSGLNIMSLGGLAIGTGIIVDDTIVVLENIFRWFSSPELSRNKTKIEIIVAATREVIRPVFISTLTNIAIFLPMLLVEGFAGRLFAPVSVTVTFALLASLIVSLTVIPAFANKWLKQMPVAQHKEDLLHRSYHRLLNFVLSWPKSILLACLLPIILVTYGFGKLGVEFLPALDEGAVLLQTIMPPGTSLSEAKRLNLKIENWLKHIEGVVTVVRRTGHAPGAEDTDNINHSDITIKLSEKAKRPVKLESFIEALKAQTSGLASINVNYLMPLADKINDAMGGVPADLGIDFYGADLEQLHLFTEQLVKQMEHIRGLTDLRPSNDIPVPSLEIKIDKNEAGRLGITEAMIHDTLQAFSIGLQATSVRELQKEIPVVLHFATPGENLQREALESLPLRTAGNNTVPIEQVASFKYSSIPSEIYHDHLSRKLTITANIKGRNSSDVAKEVAAAIETLKLPSGYSWTFSGKYQTEQKALANMGFVLLLAVFAVSFILWLEFQSLKQVALILLTLPLAAVGAILSLWLLNESLNISSMIGAVMLVGIVVRNGIMLLDYMNIEMKKGAAIRDAIQTAALKRVRPILMTAAVTVLGLLPLAAGWGTGAELQRPLAIAVIGGILTSTLLTLLVLPAAASLGSVKKVSRTSA